MPHDAPLITTFVAAFVLAFVFGAIANRLKISPIIGYMVAGIMVGPYTPGFVADVSLSKQLAELGVILLMFGVGLHFSFKKLLEVRWISLPGAIGQVAFATALGVGFGQLMGWPLAAGIVFGLCLSVASTVVLLRALEEQNLLETKRGQIAVGWLIVEDLIMILALVMLPALTTFLGDAPTMFAAGADTDNVFMTLGLTIFKVAIFIAVMIFAGPRIIPRLLDGVAMTGSRELFTLAVLAIALGIAFAAAELANASFALGAFFAGMVLAGSPLSQNAAERSLPLRDAFAVLFFVSVGMLFNPAILLTDPLPVAGVVFIILIGKSVAAFAIVLAFGYSAATAATIAISLAQVGEFSFILAGFAMNLKVLPKEAHDLILAGAIFSIMLNPLLFYLLRKYERRLDWVAFHRISNDNPASQVSYDMNNHVIVVGYGRVGRQIVEKLRKMDVPFVVIEPNPDRIDSLNSSGDRSIFGAADRTDVLIAAGIRKARAVLVAVPQAFDAGYIVRQVRSVNPDVETIVRAGFEGERDHLVECGADKILLAELELANTMVDSLFSGDAPETVAA